MRTEKLVAGGFEASQREKTKNCDVSCVYGNMSLQRGGQLAQRLERRFHIPKVTGSNPVLPTIK